MTKEIVVGKQQPKKQATKSNDTLQLTTKKSVKESLITKMLRIIVSDITRPFRKPKENKEAYDRFVELALGKK